MLQTLGGELKPLSVRLSLARALHDDVAMHLQRGTELQMRAQLGVLEGQLSELRARHEGMGARLEQRRAQEAVRMTGAVVSRSVPIMADVIGR